MVTRPAQFMLHSRARDGRWWSWSHSLLSKLMIIWSQKYGPFRNTLQRKNLRQVIFFSFKKKNLILNGFSWPCYKNESQIRLVLVAAACKLEFTTMVSSQLVLYKMKNDRQFSILSKNVLGWAFFLALTLSWIRPLSSRAQNVLCTQVFTLLFVTFSKSDGTISYHGRSHNNRSEWKHFRIRVERLL